MTLNYFLNTLSYSSELIAWLTTFLYLQCNKTKPAVISFILLTCICVVEGMGKFTELFNCPNLVPIKGANMIIQITLLLSIYFYLLKNKSDKKIIICFLFLYLVATVVDYFTIVNIQSNYPSKSYTLGSVLIIISILLYFKQLITLNKIHNIKRNYWAWVSFGLLMSCACEIPIMLLMNYLIVNKISTFNILPIFYLKFFISSIYYITYLIGFICSKKKY
jgi:hypothetical protein